MNEHTISEALPALQELAAQLAGCNKPDKASVLIRACIDAGINEGSAIVGTLHRLGLDRSHAGAVLRHGSGPNPSRFDWRKEADGTYANNT